MKTEVKNRKISLIYQTFLIKSKTKCKNPRVQEANKRKLMPLSKCTVCESKKLRFIKQQKAGGLFTNLELKTPLNKFPLLGNILF